MNEMIWLIALCGIGTFLLRWLPLWRARRQGRTGRGADGMERWLVGVGPAAIAALLVVALWDVLETDVRAGRISSVVAALACVWGARWLRGGGIAIPTLSGAIVFGLLSYWLV